MTNKDRERLIKFGMDKEFDVWRNTPLSKPFSVGSNVRLKKEYMNISIGTHGKIIKPGRRFKKGITVIKIDESELHDIPLWDWELKEYLEEV